MIEEEYNIRNRFLFFLLTEGGFVSSLAEEIARAFHEVYENLAPNYNYKTREASAVPWGEVPEQNRALMIAVVAELIEQNVIEPGDDA